MEIEQQSAVLRAMRAWLDIEQREAASDAGLAMNTLLAAEKRRACSDKTWATMLAYYATKGLHWRGGDGPLAIIIVPDSRPGSDDRVSGDAADAQP